MRSLLSLVCGVWLLSYSMLASSQTVVALLPMSGAHAMAGQHIHKGLVETLGVTNSLVVIDRSAYASMALAWQAVLQAQPALVVGPIAQSDVQWLMLQRVNVPVIALNQTAQHQDMVWQFALSPEMVTLQLADQLNVMGVERLLLLLHSSAQADRLWKAFVAQSQAEVVDAVSFTAQRDIPSHTELLLHTASGRERIQRLTRVLPELGSSFPWIRQDADAVLVVAPLSEALDVSYMIDFLWGQDLGLYWLDSGQSSVADYVNSSVNWGRMRTIMPHYLVDAMQQHRINPSTDNFFNAMGRDLALLIKLRLANLKSASGVFEIDGNLGKISMDEHQKLKIQLNDIWLGDGLVEVVQ